jgi:hypothetical protein
MFIFFFIFEPPIHREISSVNAITEFTFLITIEPIVALYPF